MTSFMISSVPAPMRWRRASRTGAADRGTRPCSRRRRGPGGTRRSSRFCDLGRSTSSPSRSRRRGTRPAGSARPRSRTQRACGLELGRRVGELVRDHLVVRDRSTERVPLARVRDRLVEDLLRVRRSILRRAGEALVLELPHRAARSPGRARRRSGWRAGTTHVVERDLRGVARAASRASSSLRDTDTPGSRGVDDEQRDAAVARAGIGLRDEREEVARGCRW